MRPLLILLQPSTSPHSWIYYRDCAIPVGDSASGDYESCAKAATGLTYLSDSPVELQETIRQALIDYTYVDDGGVGASSEDILLNLQDNISKILKKGDFYIKSWETSGQDGYSKYLGMT